MKCWDNATLSWIDRISELDKINKLKDCNLDICFIYHKSLTFSEINEDGEEQVNDIGIEIS